MLWIVKKVLKPARHKSTVVEESDKEYLIDIEESKSDDNDEETRALQRHKMARSSDLAWFSGRSCLHVMHTQCLLQSFQRSPFATDYTIKISSPNFDSLL